MELADLDIFRCVVREGGVTRAASRLHRVPSNVTTRIKQLEERLGVSLFQRQGRGLALTESGRALLGHAERLLQMADVAEQEMRSGAVRGALRLGSLESAAGARLPPILSAFHIQYPEVMIELQTGTTATLLRMLDRFEVEAAFVSEPFEKKRLSAIPAFEEELVLITARGAQAPRRAVDLNGRTLVAFPNGCSYRRRLTEWLAAEGVSAGRILDLGSYHAIVACVAAASASASFPRNCSTRRCSVPPCSDTPYPRGCVSIARILCGPGEASAPLQALMELMPRLRAGRRVAAPDGNARSR